MAWNWGRAKSQKLLQRKPSVKGDGQNSEELKKLAEEFIRSGLTRQQAYAKARAKLGENFRKQKKVFMQGGAGRPK